MKKNYLKIEFKNCDLNFDYTVADGWDMLLDILNNLEDQFETIELEDPEGFNRPEITFYPIKMTEREFDRLVEEWEGFEP